jgi:hypothetical protein
LQWQLQSVHRSTVRSFKKCQRISHTLHSQQSMHHRRRHLPTKHLTPTGRQIAVLNLENGQSFDNRLSVYFPIDLLVIYRQSDSILEYS